MKSKVTVIILKNAPKWRFLVFSTGFIPLPIIFRNTIFIKTFHPPCHEIPFGLINISTFSRDLAWHPTGDTRHLSHDSRQLKHASRALLTGALNASIHIIEWLMEPYRSWSRHELGTLNI